MAVPATRRERSYECCIGAFQGEFQRARSLANDGPALDDTAPN